MAPKRSCIWDHFDEHEQGDFKVRRVKCKHCADTVSATVTNMTTHIASCRAVPTSVGRLAESLNYSEPRGIDASIANMLKAKVTPRLTKQERVVLDEAFADALHQTGTCFDKFDHLAWRDFFDMLSPQWSPPKPAEISTSLLATSYQRAMMKMCSALSRSQAVTIGVDGATNVLSRSLSNFIAHDPRPWFVEYLDSNLQKESAPEVTRKICTSIERLHGFVRKAVVYSFVSDSCNLMRAVRRALVDGDHVAFAYGCAAHALNNLCEDITKLPSMKENLRRALYMSKTIKNQGLLNKIYSSLSAELLGRPYAMVLYSGSRWSSVSFMFQRLAKVKRPITAIAAAIMNEKEERRIDESFKLPPDFAALSMDPGFWREVNRSGDIFDPICKCIGVLEGDASTLSTAYACFLYVLASLDRVFDSGERDVLRKKLQYRWDRIWSPVHALAFYCDPFFKAFRIRALEVLGAEIVGLGHGDIYSQCRSAIQLLCRSKLPSDDAARRAVNVFMQYCMEEESIVASWAEIIDSQPRKIWTQALGQFPVLAALLIKVYSAPGSTAGVERHHKVSKRIHTALRNRMGHGKVEEQVVVAHNSSVSEMQLPSVRHPFEVKHLVNIFASSAESVAASPVADTVDDDSAVDSMLESLTDGELLEQERLNVALNASDAVVDISDELMFRPELD